MAADSPEARTMVHARGLTLLVITCVFVLSGCSYRNPAGLVRQGDQVSVLSSCTDRGITSLSVYLVPEAFDEEVDLSDPMYTIAAPDVEDRDSPVGVEELVLDQPPADWSVEGGMAFVSDATELLISVEYGDAEGDATELRLEQIVPGLVWLDDQNVPRADFDEAMRVCDPGIELSGWMNTLVTFTIIVAVAAVIVAPLLFVTTLGREAVLVRRAKR